jgi:hypothetical protein
MNTGLWQATSNNLPQNIPECIRTVTTANAVSSDKSTTPQRTLLCTHKKIPSTKHASLEIECILNPTYERERDEYIMDVVCAPTTALEMDRKYLKYYTDTEIRQIYYCKSFLNVQRVSDLCTADGDFILPSIAKGEQSIRQCASRLEAIRQEQPEGNSWTIWR